jgi:DNA-binding MarR family transcriptional regulator
LKKKTVAAAAPPDIVNPLLELLGYQLRRASQAMLDDLLSSMQEYDLRPTSASVLMLVAANPGITQSRLGQILAIERANMTPMTAALTQRGYLSKTRTDGRSQGLSLSESGSELVTRIRKRIADHERKFLGALDKDERAALLRVLNLVWAPET